MLLNSCQKIEKYCRSGSHHEAEAYVAISKRYIVSTIDVPLQSTRTQSVARSRMQCLKSFVEGIDSKNPWNTFLIPDSLKKHVSCLHEH